jgi:hypothetical protein
MLNATDQLRRMEQWPEYRELACVPNEPTPVDGTGSVGGGYRTRKYGIECFGDFFNQTALSATLYI